MADVIEGPIALIKKKHGDLVKKLDDVEDFQKKETASKKEEFLDHYKDMYDFGLAEAKDRFKKEGHDKALVHKNEDKVKDLVSDMIFKYGESHHKEHFNHFKEEIKGMDTEKKYNFATNLMSLYSKAAGSDEKKSLAAIVAKHKTNEKSTVRDVINEIGDNLIEYRDDTVKNHIGKEISKKVQAIDDKHRDELIHMAKYGAAIQGYDPDGTGNFHLTLLKEGGAYQMADMLRKGVDKENAKGLGLKHVDELKLHKDYAKK